MKFTLTIDCENAAFDEDPGHEVVEILHRIGDQLDNGSAIGKCIDSNGNTVGTWRLG